MYLAAAYSLSSHFGMLKMCFYPTLGAFSYFFISRSLSTTDFGKIIVGAFLAASTGSALHALNPGAITFFLTCASTIGLIQLIRIPIAPLLAVSLIPFFTDLPNIWTLPLFVSVTLVGLCAAVKLSDGLQALWLLAKAQTKAAAESKTANL
jgi:hypothetical protein